MIPFEIAESGRVVIQVFDVMGRQVRELVSTDAARGRHEVEWDGRDGAGHPVSNGVYFVRLQHGQMTDVIQVVRTSS